jgi:hypothetical protein
MKTLTIPLLAIVLAASNGHSADSAPQALLNKLRSLAGSSARDCGSVALPDDHDAAIACAKDATTAGNAYRIAVQLQGTDSLIWQGAARDEYGKLWVAFYDTDTSGGPAAGPTLSVLSCREILFAVKGSDALECKPFFGEPWRFARSDCCRELGVAVHGALEARRFQDVWQGIHGISKDRGIRESSAPASESMRFPLAQSGLNRDLMAFCWGEIARAMVRWCCRASISRSSSRGTEKSSAWESRWFRPRPIHQSAAIVESGLQTIFFDDLDLRGRNDTHRIAFPKQYKW